MINKMMDKIKEFKAVITFVIFIITLTVTIPTYFVLASDFKAFKKETYDYRDYQRLEYIDKNISDLQITYKCYHDECAPPAMPGLLYDEYRKKIIEKSILEEKLYPNIKNKINKEIN